MPFERGAQISAQILRENWAPPNCVRFHCWRRSKFELSPVVRQIDNISGEKVRKMEQAFFKRVGTYQYFVQNTPNQRAAWPCTSMMFGRSQHSLSFLGDLLWFVINGQRKLFRLCAWTRLYCCCCCGCCCVHRWRVEQKSYSRRSRKKRRSSPPTTATYYAQRQQQQQQRLEQRVDISTAGSCEWQHDPSIMVRTVDKYE